MKISELIAELEKAKAEHGDVFVYVFDGEMGYEEGDSVRVLQADKDHYWVPDGLVIERA